jgi:serine/threonine-protein kinase
VNLEGKEEQLEVPPKEYRWVRLSGDIIPPKVVTEVENRIWIYDTGSSSSIHPLTSISDGLCSWPVWIPPDNREVVFHCNISGTLLLKRIPTDGSDEAEVISVKASRWSAFAPDACTPDGKVLLATAVSTEETAAAWDWVMIDLERDGEVELLLECKNNEGLTALSPDGKWLAYTSGEQGRDEVFVTAWPDLKGKRQVSTEGAREPVWAPDCKTIYYRDGKSLVAVSVQTEGGFTPGRAQRLFDDVYKYSTGRINRTYDIHPDGKRFLMIKKVGEEVPITELFIVENWFEELKRRVPPE